MGIFFHQLLSGKGSQSCLERERGSGSYWHVPIHFHTEFPLNSNSESEFLNPRHRFIYHSCDVWKETSVPEGYRLASREVKRWSSGQIRLSVVHTNSEDLDNYARHWLFSRFKDEQKAPSSRRGGNGLTFRALGHNWSTKVWPQSLSYPWTR